MITQNDVGRVVGREVYGSDGSKIGTVGQIWEDVSGQPAWCSVQMGMFGKRETLVPLHEADLEGDRLLIPFDKSRVKDAPMVDAAEDEPLSIDEALRLYHHYDMVVEDPEPSDPDDAMTRSEERLRVGTERERVGRARLRKYVVTEHQQVTVPVSHEEVVVEREPITEETAAAAYAGPDISEAEHEVTLHAERPVVEKEAVPVERVRMSKETVTEQETVGDKVRKERIEAEVPEDEGPRDVT
ncbi:PRC and DUF2382 domain-containing protein [Asanoa sp. NPDC049573]|uniref:PRC and DUF2382 domain-containing protein n=1 Tax=Asanoa sp. NPDC049573 TaxID=3155396 RepID=UPI003412011B